MLHTRDALNADSKEILRAVTEFKALEYGQLLKLLDGKEQTADAILKNLSKQGRVYHDTTTGIVADSLLSAENPDVKIIKALWVFLEFHDKAEYYNAGDYPVLISFFANQEHYEIMYSAYGNEIIINHTLSKSKSDSKRIVIIDRQDQIKKLKVPNLLCYCTVTSWGDVHFYQFE